MCKVCVCRSVYAPACVCGWVHVCVGVCTCVGGWMYVCGCACMVGDWMCTYVHICAHICVHICMPMWCVGVHSCVHLFVPCSFTTVAASYSANTLQHQTPLTLFSPVLLFSSLFTHAHRKQSGGGALTGGNGEETEETEEGDDACEGWLGCGRIH